MMPAGVLMLSLIICALGALSLKMWTIVRLHERERATKTRDRRLGASRDYSAIDDADRH
jgi:hypothetical protein